MGVTGNGSHLPFKNFKFKTKMVTIDILENDEFGKETGKIAALVLDDYLINIQSLDCFEDWNTKFRYESTWLGGRIILDEYLYFKVYKKIRWAGSIRWNSYVMPYGYALSLINCLLKSKRFYCEEAETGVFQKIKNGEDLTGDDFEWYGIEPIEPLIYNENQLHLPL